LATGTARIGANARSVVASPVSPAGAKRRAGAWPVAMATTLRIAACRDPGAHGATAPRPTFPNSIPVQGAKARAADAARPPSEGINNVQA
jgi:hypothetical protein